MKHHGPTVLITLALALGLFGCAKQTTPIATLTPRPTATQMPAFTPTVMPAARTTDRLSRFGVYEGYSDTFAMPRLDPPPTISVLRSADYASLIELPVIPRAGAHQLPLSGVGAQTADGVSDWGPPIAVSALIVVALVYGRAARRSFLQREDIRQIVPFLGLRASWYLEPPQQRRSLPSWHTAGARSIASESSTAKLEMTTTASGPAILTVAGPAHGLAVVHRNAWHRTLFAQSEWDGELGVTRVGNDGAGHRNNALDTAWDGDPASGFSLN